MLKTIRIKDMKRLFFENVAESKRFHKICYNETAVAVM